MTVTPHPRVLHALAQPDVTLPRRDVSFGEGSGVVRLDPHVVRRVFPERWAAFLRAQHRDPTEVAFVYGVTDRAARDWWDGVSGPRGASVVIAAAAYPAQFKSFLVEAA
jgi:hypothetical protein